MYLSFLGVSYAEIGQKLGKSEDEVVSCTCPTFNLLENTLILGSVLTSKHADPESVKAVAAALNINTPVSYSRHVAAAC